MLTPESLKLFLSLCHDAGNWNDMPMIDITPAQRGNLTQIKKEGLIKTDESDDILWALFTQAGVDLAAQHGYPGITINAK